MYKQAAARARPQLVTWMLRAGTLMVYKGTDDSGGREWPSGAAAAAREAPAPEAPDTTEAREPAGRPTPLPWLLAPRAGLAGGGCARQDTPGQPPVPPRRRSLAQQSSHRRGVHAALKVNSASRKAWRHA